MRCLGVATEFDDIVVADLQHLFHVRADFHQRIFALTLAGSPRPHPDSIEGFAHVDHDAHDLVAVVFECLADGRELGVQPQLVDVDDALVFELVCPFAAMFVLRIFPLRSHAFLEQVVVGLDGEIRAGGYVVLFEK